MLKDMISQVLILTLLVTGGLFVGIFAKDVIRLYNTAPIVAELDTTEHFQNASEKVVIYTAEWCPYCKKLKEYLLEKGITYEDRDIEKGTEEDKKLYASLGQNGIPKIIIGNKVINGFNRLILEKEINKLQIN